MRESYGRNIYGQSVLLARRLIEAGTRVACISWAPDANATWDTHGDNFAKLKKRAAAAVRRGVSSLLTDLSDRGMLERTLVVVMGEFGRSPKVNSGAGRDHWNFCYGPAGRRRRQGRLRPRRQRQNRRPSQPLAGDAGDIIATIYHGLGISPELELHDRLNRPILLLPEGARRFGASSHDQWQNNLPERTHR